MAVKSEAIDMAIEMEEQGYKYYTDHAQKTDNPWVETVLKSLADREMEHIRAIKRIAEGKPITSTDIKVWDIESEMKQVFQKFSAKEREDWKTKDVSVYEHALELEKQLYDLYRDLSDQAENKDERDFFQSLMNEEDKHYGALQNVLYYLTDHDRWMADEEGKIWGWMNV